MGLAATVLYQMARLMYRGHAEPPPTGSAPPRSAVVTSVGGAVDPSRSSDFSRFRAAAQEHQIRLTDAVVLDFGCHDGALSGGFLAEGARRVIGVDVNKSAIQRAQARHTSPALSFLVSSPDRIPVDDGSVDVVVSFDVFEHVNDVDAALAELHRVLKPDGRVLIGLCGGWHHPFAPHMRSVMPVPWAHVFFSERTVMQASRRVYDSSWYVPRPFELDAEGRRRPDLYAGDSISNTYLNKFLLRDFEAAFARSPFDSVVQLLPFNHRLGALMLRRPGLREMFTGYAWCVLTKRLG